MPSESAPTIRRATPADLPALLAMIEALARHHGDEPRASLSGLKQDLFEPEPWATVLVADVQTEIAFAVALTA